jgi:type II secretory pathway pseudopilin PulG
MTKQISPGRCRGVRRGERLVQPFGVWHKCRDNAFTLIELVVVFGLIIVLAGLVLSTAGYARKKGARARAETEIAAMSAACESYKADNGVYPANAATNRLDPKTNGDPSSAPCPSPCPDPMAPVAYSETSLYLYKQLSGDISGTRNTTGKSYMAFKPNMLFPADQTQNVQYIQDPFGYSYGYSTANQSDPTKGYNPTFDLWSTGGETGPKPGETFQQYQLRWIKSW